jgi:hypothetical protein
MGSPVGPAARVPSYQCYVCGKSTREGKPYCPEHVMSLGYPKRISDRWNLIMAERNRLEDPKDPDKPARPNASWLLTQECLLIVAAQELVCCRSKICRELGLSPENAEKVAKASGLKGVHTDRSVVYKPGDALEILIERKRG